MAEIINLTPHAISMADENGITTKTYPPSGTIARVSVTQKQVGIIDGFPVYEQEIGTVENLPKEQEKTFFLVSALVKSATLDRNDVIAPDTGKTAVRDKEGKIIAVKGFVR